jgi:hypothetical protein
MPSLSTAKLIGMGVGLLAVIAFVLMAFHWKGQAADRKEKLEVICLATRQAAGNPKLACKDVPVQIQLMGGSIANLKAGIGRQNAAVDAMGQASANAQREAEKAVSAAKERAKGASATSDRLSASSRSSERQARPCEASDELRRAWR